MSLSIELKGLARWYGRVVGLIEADLQFGSGVTGILGPNGAGKSTLLNLVTGQIRPSRGSVLIDGQTIWNQPLLYRRIGFCPEGDRFYWSMTGLQFVTELTAMHGFSRQEAEAKARKSLGKLGMSDAMHRRINTYSKGMRQRTKFAQALAHDPDILVLDEPLTGTDPQGRRLLIDQITTLGESGKTVLVSSHILHEVEAMTDQVVVVHQGRIRASGSVSEIRNLLDHFPMQIRISGDNLRPLAQALLSIEDVVSAELHQNDRQLFVKTRQASSVYRVLPELICSLQLNVEEIEGEDSSLEAVFDYLMAGVSARLRGSLR